MNAPLPTERQVHRAILQMVRTCFPTAVAHHSPNGAHLAGTATSRFKQVGALKGDGMIQGFPDLAIFWSPATGAMIEVKRPKLGRLSDEQKTLHERLRGLGWKVAVVTSVDEAYVFLRECGAPWSGVDCRQDKSDPLWGSK